MDRDEGWMVVGAIAECFGRAAAWRGKGMRLDVWRATGESAESAPGYDVLVQPR